MKVNIKTLGLVHIGSGEDINPTEYLIDDYFHRIHLEGLFADADFKPLIDKFIISAGTQRYIGLLVPKNLLKKHILYKIPITGKAKEYLTQNRTIVKGFIKTAGRVFIPGSSLKGGILSAVLWRSLKDAYQSHDTFQTRQGETILAKDFVIQCLQGRRFYDDLLDFAFSRFSTGVPRNRFAHWLDVADAENKSPADVLQISLARVKGSRSGRELPILYETLKEGVEFSIEIKCQNTKLNESDVLSITNEFYQRVLQKDKTSIKSNGTVMRLGQGMTAYATSCLLIAEELGIRRYRLRPPVTRKRIDQIQSLGWVQITKGQNL